jgi:hypothetical protein
MKTIAEKVMQTVSATTDQSPHDILSAKKNIELVDARHLFVKLANESGLYPNNIAKYCNVTVRTIQNALAGFDDRIRWNHYLRSRYEAAKKQLRNNSEI